MQKKMTLCPTKAQMIMKEPMNQNKCLNLDAVRRTGDQSAAVLS